MIRPYEMYAYLVPISFRVSLLAIYELHDKRKLISIYLIVMYHTYFYALPFIAVRSDSLTMMQYGGKHFLASDFQ